VIPCSSYTVLTEICICFDKIICLQTSSDFFVIQSVQLCLLLSVERPSKVEVDYIMISSNIVNVSSQLTLQHTSIKHAPEPLSM